MRPRFHKGLGSGGQRPTELQYPFYRELNDISALTCGEMMEEGTGRSCITSERAGFCEWLFRSPLPGGRKLGSVPSLRGLLGGRAGPPGVKGGGKEKSHLGQSYLLYTAILKGKVDYDLCFMVEETGSERLGNLSKVTQQGHGKTEAPTPQKGV